MSKTCSACGGKIPPLRLAALPDTTTCVKCSAVKKHEGLMVYGHKTAGTLSFLPTDPEMRRQALAAHRRQR